MADLKKITLSKNSLKIENLTVFFFKKLGLEIQKNFTRIVFEFNKPFIVPKSSIQTLIINISNIK